MKVSIVVRAYNAEPTVGRALTSAVNQDFSPADFEVVVVNDGSTDGTRQELRRWESRSLRVIDQVNRGAVAAANEGFRQSRGTYVVLLDSDDEFQPFLLRRLTAILDAEPALEYAYGDYLEVRRSGTRRISPRNVFETVAVGLMIRRTSLVAEGFLLEGVAFAEYELLLRTLGRWQGRYHAEMLFTYHRRAASLTGDSAWVSAGLQQLRDLHPGKGDRVALIRSYALD